MVISRNRSPTRTEDWTARAARPRPFSGHFPGARVVDRLALGGERLVARRPALVREEDSSALELDAAAGARIVRSSAFRTETAGASSGV
jgi:hypothetical protein